MFGDHNTSIGGNPNAKHPAWDSRRINANGKDVFKAITGTKGDGIWTPENYTLIPAWGDVIDGFLGFTMLAPRQIDALFELVLIVPMSMSLEYDYRGHFTT